MKRIIFIALTLLCAMLPAIVCAQRHATAAARLNTAQNAYSQTLKDVQEVVSLRSKQQVVNAVQRPPQDVIALVNSTLATAGIPSNRLKHLTPESDSSLTHTSGSPGPKFKRQSVRLALENLSVQEIGLFLSEWRSSQQMWTPTGIELNHVRKQDDNRYDATIVLSAIYIAES